MNIKELKEIIKDLPDEMPVGLIDGTTDDSDDMNYGLKPDDFVVDDYYDNENGDLEPKGKMLFIYFENKLNENPLPKYDHADN